LLENAGHHFVAQAIDSPLDHGLAHTIERPGFSSRAFLGVMQALGPQWTVRKGAATKAKSGSGMISPSLS